ncbi:MAG TPA: crotonase/enoyl-CoA hydratase family protein [Baekduia sp.]|nr:crotonase/enoyl-CoA hydratase family protein [Baekduia sp.]
MSVRAAAEGGVLTITIDRPQARNAVDPAVAQGIEAALDRLEADDALRAGILTGVPPVFCAGADLRVVGEGRTAELSTERGGFAGLTRRERAKPLIAAVDGPALAGGFELVLACDLVVASAAAEFALPEVRRGLVAAAGGLARLPQRLPLTIALEAVLTGMRIDAEEAAGYGLVNRLCAPGEALGTARALAEEIVLGAPLAVGAALAAMRRDPRQEADAWARSDAAAAAVTGSDDVQEGVRAFFEKRPPRWRGR